MKTDLLTPSPSGLLARLPGDRPFTVAEAREAGLAARQLALLVAGGLLRHPVRGVYVPIQLDDDLALRVRVLSLVVPGHAVVTDRTAGWLWGADMILAPNDHLAVPAVSVFCKPGLRLRNGLVSSGERGLRLTDVVELGGIRVTTPLRTACDLGRLLHRDQAFAALDAMARLAKFTLAELLVAVLSYPGYRGVIQFRSLAPFVDPGAESPEESILRLRWLDAGLPRPECQIQVTRPGGSSYRIDLGLQDERFGAEYDGVAHHGEQDTEHDDARRLWLREDAGWELVVARRDNIHGRQQDIHASLLSSWTKHMKR